MWGEIGKNANDIRFPKCGNDVLSSKTRPSEIDCLEKKCLQEQVRRPSRDQSQSKRKPDPWAPGPTRPSCVCSSQSRGQDCQEPKSFLTRTAMQQRLQKSLNKWQSFSKFLNCNCCVHFDTIMNIKGRTCRCRRCIISFYYGGPLFFCIPLKQSHATLSEHCPT